MYYFVEIDGMCNVHYWLRGINASGLMNVSQWTKK